MSDAVMNEFHVLKSESAQFEATINVNITYIASTE